MDWEEANRFTQECIDKRFLAIQTVLSSNKVQIMELAKLAEMIEKKYAAKTSNPTKSNTQRDLRMKSPIHPKVSVDAKKVILSDSKKKLDAKKVNEGGEKKKEIAGKAKEEEGKADANGKKRESLMKVGEKTVRRSMDVGDPKAKEELKEKPHEVKHVKGNASKPDISKSDLKTGKVSGSHPEIAKPPSKIPQKSKITEKPIRQPTPKLEDPKAEVASENSNAEDKNSIAEDTSEKNPISLTPSVKNYTKEELNSLIMQLGQVPNEKKFENFAASMGLQITLHSLSHIDKNKFYLTSNEPRPEFLWVFKVIWRFQGKNIEDNEKLLEEIKEFIASPKDKSRLVPDVGQKFVDLLDNFDFSNENMDNVESVMGGIDLDVKIFSEKCEVSGILLHLIKEAALFGGILLPEGSISTVHSRYTHKLNQLTIA